MPKTFQTLSLAMPSGAQPCTRRTAAQFRHGALRGGLSFSGERIKDRSRRRLSEDAILEVLDLRTVDRADGFESDAAAMDVVEKPGASAQQARHDVNLHLVEQIGREVLLNDIGTAAERHILAVGCLPLLGQRGLDAIREKWIPPSPSGCSRLWFGPAT